MEYFLGSLAGVLVIPLVYALATSPVAAMVLVLFTQNVRALGFGAEALPFGTVDVTIADVVYAFLFLAAIVRLLHRNGMTWLEFAWLVFGALGIVAFIRGLDEYGLQLAGGVRATFYFTTAILYFMTLPVDRPFLNRVAKLWIANGVFLGLLAMFYLATKGYGVDLYGVHKRPLHAHFAFQVLEAAMIGLYLRNRRGHDPIWGYLGVCLIPVVVLMQYRTVWITAAFVVLYVVLYERRVRSSLLLAGSVFGLIGVIVALVASGDSLAPVAGRFAHLTTHAVSEDSTLLWRFYGWQAVWESYSFGLDTFIGEAAGTGRTLIAENFIYAHTHSQYLLVLLRNGLIGFAILIATYWFAMRRLRYSPPPQDGEMISGGLLRLILITQLIFYFSYDTSYDQYAWLGIAVAYAARIRLRATSPEARRARDFRLALKPGPA